MTRPRTHTVEDPNESFDEMRDKADLQTILAQPALGELLQRLPLDKQLLSEIRLALKLDKRQFARLIEMAVLLKLGLNEAPNDKHFRLLVKERLYRHNQVGRRRSLAASGRLLWLTLTSVLLHRTRSKNSNRQSES